MFFEFVVLLHFGQIFHACTIAPIIVVAIVAIGHHVFIFFLVVDGVSKVFRSFCVCFPFIENLGGCSLAEAEFEVEGVVLIHV